MLEDNIQKAVVAVQQAHECLESGLTTVGEISRFGIHIRNMVEAGVMKGPRIVATGLGFCATAGHGDSHRLSIEQNLAAHPWAECVDSPWDLRKAVRRRIRENLMRSRSGNGRRYLEMGSRHGRSLYDGRDPGRFR